MVTRPAQLAVPGDVEVGGVGLEFLVRETAVQWQGPESDGFEKGGVGDEEGGLEGEGGLTDVVSSSVREVEGGGQLARWGRCMSSQSGLSLLFCHEQVQHREGVEEVTWLPKKGQHSGRYGGSPGGPGPPISAVRADAVWSEVVGAWRKPMTMAERSGWHLLLCAMERTPVSPTCPIVSPNEPMATG